MMHADRGSFVDHVEMLEESFMTGCFLKLIY